MEDFGFAICADLVHLAFLQNAAYVQSQVQTSIPVHCEMNYILMAYETFFRWCNETYNRWPLGSSCLCYMDPWYNHIIGPYIFVMWHDMLFSSLNLDSLAETCLKDVKRMEPIDGLSRINKVCPSLCFWCEFPISIF